MSEELYHWGVKGMRWGVRKSEDEIAAEREARVTESNEKLEMERIKNERVKIKEETARRKARGKAIIVGAALASIVALKITSNILKKRAATGRTTVSGLSAIPMLPAPTNK